MGGWVGLFHWGPFIKCEVLVLVLNEGHACHEGHAAHEGHEGHEDD